MFIYKITNRKNGKCYIGLDTKPQYKCARWKLHKREYHKGGTKFYNALKKDIDAFTYEVIDEGEDIVDLAFKEIKWIAHYDSYKNGYNSSEGGDGIGYHDLSGITEEQLSFIKEALSRRLSEYNNKEKWADKTEEERKELCSHLHTEEIYQKRAKSLKNFYKQNPEAIEEKSRAMSTWCKENKEKAREIRIANGMKGAAKVSKGVKVITPKGKELTYESKSAFNREHGHIINRIITKTQNGQTHNGWKGWEI